MSTYNDIPTLDVALGRLVLRRAVERARGGAISVEVYSARIDQLLDRRLELMRAAVTS